MFYIDLAKTDKEIREVEDALVYNELKDFLKGSYDVKTFDSEKDAETYLKKYEKTFQKLKKIKKIACPKMLYKRRYLIQTLMEEKMQTVRSYKKKNLTPGTVFQLYDQTYYVTVKITEVIDLGDGDYEYRFTLNKET